MKFVFIGIGIIILGVVAFTLLAQDENPNVQAVTWPSGSLTIEGPNSHDWKDINIRGGDVEHVFNFRNDSTEPLEIKTASTSCMCTTATITVGDAKPQEFGMHNNLSDWGVIVEPGRSFSVKVVFDPLAHGPDAVGLVQRSVYLETSATADTTILSEETESGGSILELRVSGDVLYEDEFLAKQNLNAYEYTFGDFNFKEKEFDFGVIKQSAGIQTHEFAFQYMGENTIDITGTPASCACTSAEASQTKLSKGDEGVITLSFDPNLHEEPEGRFFKTITVLTDPAQEVTPELKMWAEMDLDLGKEAYKLQEHND